MWVNSNVKFTAFVLKMQHGLHGGKNEQRRKGRSMRKKKRNEKKTIKHKMNENDAVISVLFPKHSIFYYFCFKQQQTTPKLVMPINILDVFFSLL
jgi:hypothetical protein